MKNKKIIFSLACLALVGCSNSPTNSSNTNTPTAREAICNDIKSQLMSNPSSAAGIYSNQNQINPAQQAELMRKYEKNNCDQY